MTSVPANDAAGMPGGALAVTLDRLAQGCRILEQQGHACRTLGHAALRDPEGRGLWVKRWGISFGETRDWRDFVLIGFSGVHLFGSGKAPSEWPIHAGVFGHRSDIAVVVHSHPFHGRVFSAVTEPLRPVSNAGNWFPAPPPRFTVTSELVRDIDTGNAIGKCLGDNFAVFLRNHGVVFCGTSVEQAVLMGIQLEEACREHLLAASSGLAWDYPGAEEHARKYRASGSTLQASFDRFAGELDEAGK